MSADEVDLLSMLEQLCEHGVEFELCHHECEPQRRPSWSDEDDEYLPGRPIITVELPEAP